MTAGDSLYALAAGLVLVGALFSLLAAIGLVRFPDVFTRLHAASKAGFVGTGLILTAAALVAGDVITVVRALLALLFLLLSTPLGAHLIARAALSAGIVPKTGKGPQNGL
jgi:multicomponent Na+:H+ antiporter subunit G